MTKLPPTRCSTARSTLWFIACNRFGKRLNVSALTDRRRRSLFQIAAALCAIPAILVPLACRSAYDLSAAGVSPIDGFTVRALSTEAPEKPVRVERDPFIADNVRKDQNQRARKESPQDCISPSVRAVVLGASPHALIDCGNT